VPIIPCSSLALWNLQYVHQRLRGDALQAIEPRRSAHALQAQVSLVYRLRRFGRGGFAVAEATAKPTYELAAQTSAANRTSDRSVQNEILAIKAVRKAGYGTIEPHADALTHNKWIEQGFQVKLGEKSVKVKNLRLFHKSQVCRVLRRKRRR
jgi:hypothetical protein